MDCIEFDMEIVEVKQRKAAEGHIAGRMVVEFNPMQKDERGNDVAVLAMLTGHHLANRWVHCTIEEVNENKQ